MRITAVVVALVATSGVALAQQDDPPTPVDPPVDSVAGEEIVTFLPGVGGEITPAQAEGPWGYADCIATHFEDLVGAPAEAMHEAGYPGGYRFVAHLQELRPVPQPAGSTIMDATPQRETLFVHLDAEGRIAELRC